MCSVDFVLNELEQIDRWIIMLSKRNEKSRDNAYNLQQMAIITRTHPVIVIFLFCFYNFAHIALFARARIVCILQNNERILNANVHHRSHNVQ